MANRSSPETGDLPPLEKVIAALKIGHKYLGPDDVDLAAAAWLERLSAPAQGTISPEYAAELGRQVDELEAENAALRAQCAAQPEPVAWRWLIHGIYHYSGGFPVSGAEALYLRPSSTLSSTERDTPEGK